MVKVFCDFCYQEIDTTTYRTPTKNRCVEILMRDNCICSKCAKEIAEYKPTDPEMIACYMFEPKEG